MGAGLKPAGAALRSHTAKNPETDASGAKNGILKGLNPCQNPKNPSKCRAERLAVSNCAVVQQPANIFVDAKWLSPCQGIAGATQKP